MFERFTRPARAVVRNAVAEHERRGDPMIGTEHLLVGVAAVESARASALLSRLGVTVQGLRAALDARDADALAAVGIDVDAGMLDTGHVAPPAFRRGHHPFSAAAKATLEDALREALALRHRHIGVEHIALALTRRAAEDPVHRLLERIDVAPPDLRDALLTDLRASA